MLRCFGKFHANLLLTATVPLAVIVVVFLVAVVCTAIKGALKRDRRFSVLREAALLGLPWMLYVCYTQSCVAQRQALLVVQLCHLPVRRRELAELPPARLLGRV